ncbi:MAG: glycosyltransferase [Ilumatobacteraceae bacterium]|nr:glycosyltransferase [Ilumatobacteraceae bacterium]
MTERRLRIHFVWTGRHFPYHARLAVESAIVAEPDAAIEIHIVGEPPTTVDFEAVRRRPEVTTRWYTLPTLFERCPTGQGPLLDLVARIPDGAASAVSNLVRLAVLWERGGIYLDTDVLVRRRLTRPGEAGSFVGCELVWGQNRRRVAGAFGTREALRAIPWAVDWTGRRLDCRLTHGSIGLAARPPVGVRHQVNNAVIGAPAGSSFVRRALDGALDTDPTVRYALGPSLLDDVARSHPATVTVHPPSRYYAVPPGQSFRCFEDRTLTLPPDAHVMHYVASNHRRLLRELRSDDVRFVNRSEPFWREARRVREQMRRTSDDRMLVR